MRIAVVGGGISGLATAWRLLGDSRGDHEVTVLEASSRLGGKIAGLPLAGLRLDGGAESVLARRPEGIGLLHDLGLADGVVHPTLARPAVLVEGRLEPLPASVLGVPTDPAGLAGLLTPYGLARALAEPGMAPLREDVAIGSLVDEQFGPEVTDRLLEPMLGGVYAGRARELSFEAVAPTLYERARTGGRLSALAGSAAAGDRGTTSGPAFAGLCGGVSSLVDALAEQLAGAGVVLRTGAAVRALDRSGSRFRLTVGSAASPEARGVDGVVLACPAPAAGRLLSGLVPTAAEWAAIPYASVAVLTFVLDRPVGEHSGVLVPVGGLPTVKALTYSSRKWEWVATAAEERCGHGAAVVRASVGRIGEEPLLQLDDGALVDRTAAELIAGVPGWAGARVLHAAVSRWGGALPQYLVGHRRVVARLRARVAEVPGLAVCGAALDGVGIAACIGSAEAAVAKLGADFGGSGPGERGEGGR